MLIRTSEVNSLSFGLLVAILALLFVRVLLLPLFLLCFVRVTSPFFRLHFCCVLSDFPLILMLLLLFLFTFGGFVGVSVDVLLFQVRVFWLSRDSQVNDGNSSR